MAGPLDTYGDMQRTVLRKGEATSKGGHAFQDHVTMLILNLARDDSQFASSLCSYETQSNDSLSPPRQDFHRHTMTPARATRTSLQAQLRSRSAMWFRCRARKRPWGSLPTIAARFAPPSANSSASAPPDRC